jgi:hypothetical protein
MLKSSGKRLLMILKEFRRRRFLKRMNVEWMYWSKNDE